MYPCWSSFSSCLPSMVRTFSPVTLTLISSGLNCCTSKFAWNLSLSRLTVEPLSWLPAPERHNRRIGLYITNETPGKFNNVLVGQVENKQESTLADTSLTFLFRSTVYEGMKSTSPSRTRIVLYQLAIEIITDLVFSYFPHVVNEITLAHSTRVVPHISQTVYLYIFCSISMKYQRENNIKHSEL
ncbi:hypothetical protein HUJ05_006482 [Dendroctonus ponderosae]|nr:hypothetical protein HUJ05_006482 [Dendroctonus ponderosae]